MEGKSIYTEELGREIAMKAKGVPGHYMVIPLLKNKWAVVADGRTKPTSVFRTKDEAVDLAKVLAQSKQGDVAVLDKNAAVTERIFF